jgi:hypothetical protein
MLRWGIFVSSAKEPGSAIPFGEHGTLDTLLGKGKI